MMKFRKVNFGIFLLLFLVCSISAEAAGYQLRVSLGEEGSQVKLSAYKIADAKEDEYEWLSKYEGIDIQLSKLKKAKEIKDASRKVYSWIKEKNIQADQSEVTNESGETVFSVEAGAYLIAKESAEGEMAPVLVMIPEGYDSQSFDIAPKYSNTEEEKIQSSVQMQGTVTSDQKGKGAGTGDDAKPILWVGVMAVAVIAGVFIAKSKRKKE